VHIFDFNNDIYGREISVQFERFVRNDMKFNSIDEMKSQILRDREEIRDMSYEL
jgi:riboflavin kinase/FMN adenylyltransferase